jgi:hypothetical protein
MENPELQSRLLRILALQADVLAAQYRMSAAIIEASAAMRGFVAICQAGFDEELAAHPDMAELNVRLDGFYGGSTP